MTGMLQKITSFTSSATFNVALIHLGSEEGIFVQELDGGVKVHAMYF